MSDIPPEIKLTARLPEDDNCQLQAMLEQLIRRAAQQSGVTIVNIFQNPGTVVIQDQSAKATGGTTHIGEVMNEKTQIHAVGSVVNYKSSLNNVQIMLGAAASAQSPAEETVRHALKAFSEKLAAANVKDAEHAALLSQRLEELTKQATKSPPERKKGILEMSAKGLKDAATVVGDIVPGLIVGAEEIAKAIARWFSGS